MNKHEYTPKENEVIGHMIRLYMSEHSSGEYEDNIEVIRKALIIGYNKGIRYASQMISDERIGNG